jgi:serine/threonine protein kinase
MSWEAFKEIHKRKVYHGDVRPENILVRPDDSVVIVDFERSIIDAEDKLLVEEMEEVGQIVQSWS